MLTKLTKEKVKIFWHVTLLYWFNNSWRFEGLFTFVSRLKQSCMVCVTLNNTLVFVQNLNRCTLTYTKLVWGTTRWFTRTALKGLKRSINSLITYNGLSLLLRSPTLPFSTNFEYHAMILWTSGGGRPHSFVNFRCTETGDFVSWYHKTHWAFSFIDAILTLAGYATVT